MEISWAILEGTMPLLWLGISVLTLLLVTGFLINIVLCQRLRRRMKIFESASLTVRTFKSGHQPDTLLQESLQKLAYLEQELLKNDLRLSQVELKLRAGVDRAELLRFRAFENVGSDLSFAFALLNQEGSGVVLSSIHNREESRVYAKPITKGLSTYTLTGEEKEVIDRAMSGPKI